MKWVKKESVFLISVLIAAATIGCGLAFSGELNGLSAAVMAYVSENFGWLYVVFVAFLCFFLLWLALSKYGDVKLGSDEDVPEYSNFHWYAMLFCGGTGIGLVFWSIAEPLSHFVAPPAGISPGTAEAANFSMRTCFLHWGITQWACFALVGLGMAYSQFRKNRKGLCSQLLIPVIGERIANGPMGKLIDVFTVVVSFAGVATSLGLGVSQICGGLDHLFGIPNTKETWFLIIAVIAVVFMFSAISGVSKGIKFLSSINTYIAFLVLFLGIVVGPQTKMLNVLIHGVGQHLQNFVGDVFMLSPFGDGDWIANWRIFYFAWFIAWTPFVGLFIAQISKGRTIREFIIAVVLVPTVFTIIWFSVFGAIALNITDNWTMEGLSELVASPQTAVFIVLAEYPLSRLISMLIIALLAIFFITSADSATYSLSMMTSDGITNPPIYKKVVWAVIEAAIAYILLAAGSLKPLQTISIAASLPFLFIMILMCPALMKELKKEVC